MLAKSSEMMYYHFGGFYMKKPVFYTEIAYLLGTFLLAMGTAMVVFGNFGISMVVAPAYILHLKLSAVWSWFTFGVAEYVLQGAVLLAIWVFLKGKPATCLLSFGLTLVYGVLLDGSLWLLGMLEGVLWLRVLIYLLGVLFCTAAISFLFRSYLPPAAYELMVLALQRRFGGSVSRWKTTYDCVSVLVAVILSFVLLGALEGVGVGTVICALIYGTLIAFFGKLWDRLWVFEDRFSFRNYLQ